jgi:hypothetical protein
VDGFAILQQDHPQVPIFHLRHEHPTTNPSIDLDDLPNRLANRTLNPCILDGGTIRTTANGL